MSKSVELINQLLRDSILNPQNKRVNLEAIEAQLELMNFVMSTGTHSCNILINTNETRFNHLVFVVQMTDRFTGEIEEFDSVQKLNHGF